MHMGIWIMQSECQILMMYICTSQGVFAFIVWIGLDNNKLRSSSEDHIVFFGTQSNSTQVILLHLFFFIVVHCVQTMTTTHTTRSSANKATGTKPNGRRNNSTRRSVNGKLSPRKTKPRALNDVQSAMNNVELDRTPLNITHSVSILHWILNKAHARRQVRSVWWIKCCPNLRNRGKKCSQLRSCASSGRRKPSVGWRLFFVLRRVLGVRVWSSTVGKEEGASTDFESNIDWYRTKGNEAFALLMYKNYIGKSKK